ncbi:MAG: TetR family transcriptional regulator [Anaerolineales bacterium]|nr:TetR family transcriptional regulator [Anaerolineales bacterium]
MLTMRRTTEEAAQTRQDILEAALSVFSQKGYHATRLADIANAANVTRGAIYHHFENKAKLYNDLITEASTIGSSAIQEAMASGGSFTEICAHILINSLTLLENNRQMRQITELTLFKTGHDPELLEFEAMRQQQAITVVEGVAMLMQQGIQNGDLRSDLDPFDVARAFIAFQNGLISLWLSNREAFSLAAQAPKFAAIFLQGIAA